MKKRGSCLVAMGVAFAFAGVFAGSAGAQAAEARDYAEIPHASISFKLGSYYLTDTNNLTPKSASAKRANAKYRIAYRKGSLRGSYSFAPLPAAGFGKGGSLFSNSRWVYYLHDNRVYRWKIGSKKATKSKELVENGNIKLQIVAVAKGGVYLSRQVGSGTPSLYRYDVSGKKLKRVLSKGTVLSASGDQLVTGVRSAVRPKGKRSGHYDDHAYRNVTVYQIRGSKLHKEKRLAELARSNNKTGGYDKLVRHKLKGYKAHYFTARDSVSAFKYSPVTESGKVWKSRTYRF